MGKNILIEASAGTGKTFTLVSHLTRLLLTGADPSSIVALTFSRAAAGEIFGELMARLAKGASDDTDETFNVLLQGQGLSAEMKDKMSALRPPYKAHFAKALRAMINRQHMSMIGTIDSFMGRVLQMFPIESGIQDNIRIMDEWELAEARNALVGQLLGQLTNEDKRAFLDSFRMIAAGEDSKSYMQLFSDFASELHNLYLNFPSEDAWRGFVSDCIVMDEDIARARREKLVENLEAIPEERREDWEEKVIGFLKNNVNGKFAVDKIPEPLKKMMNAVSENLTATTYSIYINKNKKEIKFENTHAATIRDAVKWVWGSYIAMKMKTMHGMWQLMNRFAPQYARTYTERGFLSFDDIPRLINRIAKEDCWDAMLWQDVQYRLDGQFAHWALDEFQDTSEQQWHVLDNVVDEARQDGEKSVFLVGDRKQAIYGWRNGKVEIFIRQVNSSAYPRDKKSPSGRPPVYERGDLVVSRRYRQEICDVVNTVFSTVNNPEKLANIMKFGKFVNASMAKAYVPWECPMHRAHDGRPGCFKLMKVKYRTDSSTLSSELRALPKSPDFSSVIRDELEKVRPWERGYTSAVLVRTQKEGKKISGHLKAAGIPVVWEGDSSVLDTPMVACFVDAIELAEFPGNELAYSHVLYSPIRKAIWGDVFPSSEEMSAKFLEMLTCHGLARMLRDIKAKLDEAKAEFDDFSIQRFDDMIQAAADYEKLATTDTRWCGFAGFLKARKVKQAQDPKKVRVMTIHNSKGLGFDYVILPLNVDQRKSRKDVIVGEKTGVQGGKCVLQIDRPEYTLCDKDLLQAMVKKQCDDFYGELCVNYVAMTRCKIALTVLVPYQYSNKGEMCTSMFGRLLLDSSVRDAGDQEWYLAPADVPDAQTEDGEMSPEVPDQRDEVPRYVREVPSMHSFEGRRASEYFRAPQAGLSGIEKGTVIHESLSQIEWLDASPGVQPPQVEAEQVNLANDSELRRALVKPEGVIDLWRERSFELVLDNKWISGQFDRVVFFDKDGVKSAVIYDYKTNARGEDESIDEFKARLAETYASQMAKYRDAVHSLTGIPKDNIARILLATEIKAAILLS